MLCSLQKDDDHLSVDVVVPVEVDLVEDVAEVEIGYFLILPRLLHTPARFLDVLDDVLRMLLLRARYCYNFVLADNAATNNDIYCILLIK